MCGFVGIFSSKGFVAGLDHNVRKMNERIKHRGPDADGFFVGEYAALGHRRLSIIDIATGQQPLWNEDETVGVAFNGEIYNFLELVVELKSLGHVFRTKSDTEVIVHAWEQWGADCVKRFRGMFAFGLIDLRQRLVFLARDRLGVKPLYYSFLNDTLIFGSELKALLVYPGLELRLSPPALEEYMALGYVPEPRTIYQSVHKLSSAHTLIFRVGDRPGSVTPKSYWDLAFTNDSKLGFAEAQVELVERLKESVKVRLMAEVPLGAFLSGGVDSSSVVALMAELSDQPVKTCSIGFEEVDFDESQYANEVAKRYRTDHFLESVSVDDANFLDKLIDVYDEPFADSSAIPTHRVCGMARRKVTVALSGDGADEVFGGYQRYADHLRTQRIAGAVPNLLRSPLRAIADGALGAGGIDRYQGFGGRTLRGMFSSATRSYLDLVSLVPEHAREKLWSSDFRSRLQGYKTIELFEQHAKNAHVTDTLGLVQYLDTKTYLIDDINTKVDRASMDFSLEVREPMMDHRLMEWAATLPSDFKIKGDQRKRLLKSSMETRLSHDLLYRKKMGFAVPVAKWIRQELRAKCIALSSRSALVTSGIFDSGQIDQMVASHLKGETDSSPAIWGLLVLDRFLERQEHQGI